MKGGEKSAKDNEKGEIKRKKPLEISLVTVSLKRMKEFVMVLMYSLKSVFISLISHLKDSEREEEIKNRAKWKNGRGKWTHKIELEETNFVCSI